MTEGKVVNVKVVDSLKVEDRQRIIGKRRKATRLYLVAGILVLLCTASSAFSVVEYQTYSAKYHSDLSLAQMGMQHLKTAETLLKGLPKNPFNTQSIAQAQHEFAAAATAFAYVERDLKSLPGISMSIPIYGARLSAALRLLPIAIELSQTGVTGCNILALLNSRLHNLLSAKEQGLTMADFSAIEKDFQQIKVTLALVVEQVNRLQPADLQADPRLSKVFATFRENIPNLQKGLDLADKLFPIAPTLLGIGTPANYMVEVLDSTELRPGGGFIGNYGILTLSGGRLSAAHVTDTYLLDRSFIAAGKSIPYPSAYSWFDIGGSSWSFRDSNLDADFPTAARYSEQNYKREGGHLPVQGVIAITPAFIKQALLITGPINIPEYHETVTPQNLIDRIHYHQLGLTSDGSSVIPSPDGLSSTRKHFIALLAEHFLARARQLAPSDSSRFLQLMASSLHAKDLQIYFNSSVAEGLLQHYQLDGAILSPKGDGLFVVDANISPNKANSFVTNTLNDQVTIDAQGNALHHTTISYAWVTKGPWYDGNHTYRDYVRVYVPPGSRLRVHDGWETRGSSRAFGHEVWAGFFTLTFGQKRTITLVWMAPGAAKKGTNGWQYGYFIQRQAGAQWTLHLRITLPSCAQVVNKSAGLVSSTRQVVTLTRSLTENTNLGMGYACH